MAHTAPTRMPGMIRTAQVVLDTAGTYGAFHEELIQAYETPDSMFREVTYGAGRQVIPRYSARGFVQYIQLLEFLIKNQDLIEDEELHHLVVLLGSAGILGSKHLAEIIGVSERLVRQYISKPHKGTKPRMGGDFNPSALWLVKKAMMSLLRDGDADYTALKQAKEAGISITLLSRLTGISAQALSRRFRKINITEVNVDHPGDGIEAHPRTTGHSTSSVERSVTRDEDYVEDRPVSGEEELSLEYWEKLLGEPISPDDEDYFRELERQRLAKQAGLTYVPEKLAHSGGEDGESNQGTVADRDAYGSTEPGRGSALAETV